LCDFLNGGMLMMHRLTQALLIRTEFLKFRGEDRRFDVRIAATKK
jgi:hypothetical protein